MKQEHWEQQLRERLADFEEAAPEGLWADIEAQIAATQQSASGHRANIISMWGRRVAAAAAFIGLMLGGGYLYLKEEPTAAQLQEHPGLSAASPSPGHPTAKPHLRHPASKPAPGSAQPSEHPTSAPPPEYPEYPSEEPATTLAQQHSSEEQHPSQEQHPSEKQQTILHQLDQEIAQLSHRLHRRFSLGLYAQNGFGRGMNANGVLMSPQMAADYAYGQSMPATSRTRQGQELIYLANFEERQKHYQPLSFGLTANIPISSGLSLVTGIVYTRLRSDFTTVMDGYQQTTEQALHYIGLPLNVQYRLWSSGGLRLYASAGTQADYNVKAQQELSGITQDISRDRWQFSVQGAVGAEYNVIPQIGIYLEPGVRHYFDNGSNVRNYFKDKPTNFNLQVGVRLNLGNR